MLYGLKVGLLVFALAIWVNAIDAQAAMPIENCLETGIPEIAFEQPVLNLLEPLVVEFAVCRLH